VTAVARVALVAGLTWALWAGFGAWRQARFDREAARSHLIDRVHEESASLGATDAHAVRRVEGFLSRAIGPWQGDHVDDPLRREGLTELLAARPSIYVRGPLDALATPSAIAGAAASSVKDSLLYCLVDPPAARTEAELLDKVRVSYGAGAAVEARTAKIRRLHELVAGMPLLQAPFVESVLRAPDQEAIERMQRDFDRAPIAQAKQAARATLLVVAVDEPGAGTGPTELDGERPHPIRLVVVDMEADAVLLRARKDVDPSWVSATRRAHYARGLDGCAFAFDVLADVKKR
jgi:hypothetical protein